MAHLFDFINIPQCLLWLVFIDQTADAKNVIGKIMPESTKFSIDFIDFPVVGELIFLLYQKRFVDLFHFLLLHADLNNSRNDAGNNEYNRKNHEACNMAELRNDGGVFKKAHHIQKEQYCQIQTPWNDMDA